MEDYGKCCLDTILSGMPDDASVERELKYLILADASLGELRVANEAARNVELPVYVAQYEDLGLY